MSGIWFENASWCFEMQPQTLTLGPYAASDPCVRPGLVPPITDILPASDDAIQQSFKEATFGSGIEQGHQVQEIGFGRQAATELRRKNPHGAKDHVPPTPQDPP